ncbi:DUF1822 family protein [Baaleninema sp.]|uniref:DUF1822 family protein n=1 Tax=Baaleninema sp. TaxID=3101197 RepID=UPI003D01D866
MSFTTIDFESESLPVPLSEAARDLAKRLAQWQPTPEKRQQVFFNTLAVWSVRQYFECLGILTQIEASDLYCAATSLCGDVADLPVVDVGRLECRPVRENDIRNGERIYEVPPEAWHDRIGYAIVSIAESLRESQILGFVETLHDGAIDLSQLQPVETLLATLETHRQRRATRLSQWRGGTSTPPWKPLSDYFGNTGNSGTSTSYAFRSEDDTAENRIERAKLLDFGIRIAGNPVLLWVAVAPEGERFGVRVRVRPSEEGDYLPPDLTLSLESPETGEILFSVRSRQADNYIQLPYFRGQSGERFRVGVKLGEVELSEIFEI